MNKTANPPAERARREVTAERQLKAQRALNCPLRFFLAIERYGFGSLPIHVTIACVTAAGCSGISA